MKLKELNKPGMFILYLLIVVFLFGCKSQQPIENKTDTKDYKFVFDSSLVKVIKTPDSNESLFVSIPLIRLAKPECDSICQAKIDEILKGINTNKTNGENKSGFYYDPYKKLLVAYNNLKGSTDSIVKSKKGSDHYFNITKTETIPVNILTREQKFNIWTGRLFWIILFIYGLFKLRKKILAA